MIGGGAAAAGLAAAREAVRPLERRAADWIDLQWSVLERSLTRCDHLDPGTVVRAQAALALQ